MTRRTNLLFIWAAKRTFILFLMKRKFGVRKWPRLAIRVTDRVHVDTNYVHETKEFIKIFFHVIRLDWNQTPTHKSMIWRRNLTVLGDDLFNILHLIYVPRAFVRVEKSIINKSLQTNFFSMNIFFKLNFFIAIPTINQIFISTHSDQRPFPVIPKEMGSINWIVGGFCIGKITTCIIMWQPNIVFLVCSRIN